ncbi:MAG: ketoacid CoA transferase [Pseudomonadales bacterium]|jgi:glutaconate CoA-transferase subunit B|nr:ketoacid CoA transferase [Pseudomonadales bacterium]MCP5321588.1 ketoacid CoA transferase [Pseudomonadales bacterium]MCP5336501.1 ketoacid CoA transferase [Pseudomonadales bacterium]
MATSEYTLAELLICAASEAWRHDGEVLATGIGTVPRLAASLSMLTSNPDLLMTDSEAFLLSVPNPMGPRPADFRPQYETWMGFSRIFDNVWGGKRHAMVGPTQIDRFGQANISCIGDYAKPKAMMLGVRGFPGNSINHANSFFVPAHSSRVFKDGECDVVASIGYNPARMPKGYTMEELVDIRLVITDLCVMDFGGPDHQLRLRSLHPGISAEQVAQNTGFPICIPGDVVTTPAPTATQLEVIRRMDPHNLRAREIKDNPPGDRSAR